MTTPTWRTVWAAHRKRVAEQRAILAAADAACETERVRAWQDDDTRLARALRDAIDAGVPVMADPERMIWASAMDVAAALRADVADPDAQHRPPVLGSPWDVEWARSLGMAL